VIAALLHDIGQVIPLESVKEVRMNLRGSSENVGRVGHEAIGAAYLRSLGFSEAVCELVNSHVAAKRYAGFCISPFQYNVDRTQVSHSREPLVL
jgi:putative nucleotidyltransferase with HDIG domain